MMKKNTKFYKFGLILSIFLAFLMSVNTIICSILSVNFVRISAALECFSIALLLFFFQKYGEQTVSKETDFWIPRKFGLGMSINPHTKASKRMTTFLICFLVFAGFLLIFL
ncbi:hypothetical protein [Lactococcus lactis]|uniref:hypothetical protein n=1 Tax=Lactococcus lactis TaxID=1358 RepID=UPI0028927910|nr:hypothetical protein [Lactococcus lactis]MDT2888053.1 hypothetical protein [Lactococcus lactis]MDT2930858.1 hypothetical protein [Lactococcus lactis]